VAVGKIASELSKVPMFAACSQRELQTVARAVREVTHKAGTVIAREGEPGIGLFIITDGTASVTIGGSKKGSITPGEFFGEIALLRDTPRTATVHAVEPGLLYALERETFVCGVTGNPRCVIAADDVIDERLAAVGFQGEPA
jgi:CRP-like cAMP-binding protein